MALRRVVDIPSTIAARLGLLLLLPILGLVAVGLWAGTQERAAVRDARELRTQAQLVEILSTASVYFDLQSASIAGFEQARALGLDIDLVTSLVGFQGADERIDEFGELDALLDEIEATPSELWADPGAVARVLESRTRFITIRSDPGSAWLDSAAVRQEIAEAMAAGLRAQIDELKQAAAGLELGAELAAMTRSRQPSADLLAAASYERAVLTEYLLPVSDLDEDERYRDLIGASTRVDYLLADLRDDLSPTHAARLDAALAEPSSVSYRQLLDEAVRGETRPLEGDDPISMIPVGLVTFYQGFSHINNLLAFDRQLSADFNASVLELESSAERRQWIAASVAALLALVTVAVSYGTIRSITRPVQSLLDRARAITEGDLSTEGPRSGPSDIGLVHRALDDMSSNLGTLSNQARALAEGRLDDDIWNENVAGPLGASVHGSVARLRAITTRLEYEASHDSLTGLPNRSAVMSFLDRCLTGPEADRQELAVLMLDLDGFKQINDDLGHLIGDEVLVHIARRLEAVAGGHLVARLGGDEFMIAVAGPDPLERAATLAERATAAASEPFACAGGTAHLSASAGLVATAGPDWLSPLEVLRRVDLALYEAKLDRGSIVRFDQQLHDSLLKTSQLQGDLRRAFDDDEFELHLQPILSFGADRIVGYEALIRWTSPHRGVVAPDLFIPVAEQSELIEQIDDWVVARAAEILARWQADPALADLTLSINISARHLSSPALVARVQEAIERHRLRADRLLIEMTESQLIPNLSRAENTLRSLRELGVRLAIDDFGTGYASVAHLRRVAFDRLKIDRSFLAHLDDETDRSLAELLVTLGRDLDLEVVAEGVESEAQLAWAAGAGCTHVQGFLIGRPGAGEVLDTGASAAALLRGR